MECYNIIKEWPEVKITRKERKPPFYEGSSKKKYDIDFWIESIVTRNNKVDYFMQRITLFKNVTEKENQDRFQSAIIRMGSDVYDLLNVKF